MALRGASQGAKSHAELCLAGVALSGRATLTSREKEKACERRLVGLLECKSSLHKTEVRVARVNLDSIRYCRVSS